MGANISTFIDTLLAAVLLQNTLALTVVMAEILSLLLVSILILAIGYRMYKDALLSFVAWSMEERRNLVTAHK